MQFDGKYSTSYGFSTVCSIAHGLRDIHKSKCKNFDLENEGQGVEKWVLCQ